MFIPPETRLSVKDNDWARQAATAILGADHPAIEVLATRLILAREPDHEIPTHSDRKTIRELEPIGLGTPEWCNQGMRTRQGKTYHVLMRDCVRWAHRHGYPVVDAYKPYLDLPVDAQQDPEEVSPDENESFRFRVQRTRDAWVEPMEKLARALYEELGQRNASADQAWVRMLANPPDGYHIEAQSSHITMRGAKPLYWADFKKRWKRYTDPAKAAL